MFNSKKHKILKGIVDNLIKISNNKGQTPNNISIFIGVTGSILEGLQNGINIVHIMNNPEFELYSNYLWKDFLINKMSERIYLYKLKRGNTLIQYSKENYFIKKFNL